MGEGGQVHRSVVACQVYFDDRVLRRVLDVDPNRVSRYVETSDGVVA